MNFGARNPGNPLRLRLAPVKPAKPALHWPDPRFPGPRVSILNSISQEAGLIARSLGDFLSGGGLRLGVSGLSRAGKTVFITSLVNNLIGRGRLPVLAAAAEGRIARAHLDPQPDDAVPRFAYEDHWRASRGPTAIGRSRRDASRSFA